MTRVLVTGAAGQVGAATVELLSRKAAYDVLAADRVVLDLADRDRIEQVVATFVPDAIVNCAAVTNVDRCEQDPDLAFAVNALGVRHLAVAATRVGAHVVHVSTDYVFDGEAGRPYDEWDAVNPLSTYARSKLGGEQELARHAESWTIARTAWVFGRRGHDFVQLVLDALRDPGGPIRFVDDQTGSPTYAPDLAEVLVRLALERRPGVFHTVNAGHCTRYRLACDVAEARGADPSVLRTTTTAELGRPARRPAFSALDPVALRLSGWPPLRHYRDALAEYVVDTDAAPAVGSRTVGS